MRTFSLLIVLALVALLPTTTTAQVDAKLNVGSALFGGIGVAADIALSETVSVAPGLGYSGNNFGIDDFSYRNFRIIPEFRHYLNPDRGADRFFVGAYGKLGFITAKDDNDDSSVNATRGALGFLFGNKWVSQSGFVFELNMGLGRATVFGSSDGGGDDEFETAFGTITAFDLRLGIIAGWRF